MRDCCAAAMLARAPVRSWRAQLHLAGLPHFPLSVAHAFDELHMDVYGVFQFLFDAVKVSGA